MPSDDADREERAERVQDHSIERERERAQTVEDALGDLGDMLGEHKYPTTSEELAVEYADQPIDLPNETEDLGKVFDRLVDERFESRDEAVEAIYHELTGDAAGPEEYNTGRNLSEVDEEADAEDGA